MSETVEEIIDEVSAYNAGYRDCMEGESYRADNWTNPNEYDEGWNEATQTMLYPLI